MPFRWKAKNDHGVHFWEFARRHYWEGVIFERRGLFMKMLSSYYNSYNPLASISTLKWSSSSCKRKWSSSTCNRKRSSSSCSSSISRQKENKNVKIPRMMKKSSLRVYLMCVSDTATALGWLPLHCWSICPWCVYCQSRSCRSILPLAEISFSPLNVFSRKIDPNKNVITFSF